MVEHGKHRPLVRVALILLALAAPASATCRQALALALDVSGSVDEREHTLEREGLAWALRDPEVQAAFLVAEQPPARLYVFEWAGLFTQAELVPWTEIRSASDLQSVAVLLTSLPRVAGALDTATGQAMLFGAAQLSGQKSCERLTLDIATDGLNNAGVSPSHALRDPSMWNVTVNALAIGDRLPGQVSSKIEEFEGLVRYLHLEVIHGPDAFVEEAEVFSDFSQAIKRKLLRELSARAVAWNMPTIDRALPGGGG